MFWVVFTKIVSRSTSNIWLRGGVRLGISRCMSAFRGCIRGWCRTDCCTLDTWSRKSSQPPDGRLRLLSGGRICWSDSAFLRPWWRPADWERLCVVDGRAREETNSISGLPALTPAVLAVASCSSKSMMSRGKRGGRFTRDGVDTDDNPRSRRTLCSTGLEFSVRSMTFCSGPGMAGPLKSRPSPGNRRASELKNNELKEAGASKLVLLLKGSGWL